MKNGLKVFLFYFFLIALVLVLVTQFFGANDKKKIEYNNIVKYFQDGQVEEFEVSKRDVITIKLRDQEKKVSYQLRSYEILRDDIGELITAQIADGTITRAEIHSQTTSWWMALLPYAIVIVVIIFVYVIMIKQMSSQGGPGKMGGFGKARVKTPSVDDKNKVVFADVAGADEEKAELEEIVEFLKDPTKFIKLGAKIPRGVLLVGPPGTGKTLLAKAVAGEAGVPFLSISGSDFVEMYVGVGASRVRDLFENARKSNSSIIFIDEIDAVGRHRGAGLGGGHDEREQTLNQLLVEMDGFGTHDGIIVIAATNRPDILDPALLRPGRFDRQITVGYPDIKGREDILKVHAKNKPMDPNVNFRHIAQVTIGFTGADLSNLLNEAALLAAKRNKTLIGMQELDDAFMKIILGTQKKTKVRSEHDNKLTAYHEAGHAVSSYYCEHTDPVKVISIIPAGNAGGVTVSMPENDASYMSKKEMFETIIRALGGRVAEELVMDDVSTGASGDIQQATKMAKNMVTRYGMSDKLGTVLYGSEHSSSEVFLGRDFSSGKDYSEATASMIDEEIRNLIGSAYEQCREILTKHMDKLVFVAEYLITHEVMDGDQFKAAMQDGATVEAIEAIAAEKAEKSKQANEEQARKNEEEAAKKSSEKEPELNSENSDGDGNVGF